MLRRLIGTVGLTLVALLAFPSAGHAQWWDWIWGLSGPQMIGGVVGCEWDLEHKSGDKEDKVECRAADYPIYNTVKPREARRVWLTLDAGIYTSTGKDSGEGDQRNRYGWFENHMVAFEPLLEIRGATLGKAQLHHSAGVTYDVLFGKHFSVFDNAGFKFRPIAVTFPNGMNASFTLRYYPNRFTSEDFGIVNPNERKDGGEWVWGFSYGVRIKK